jgi:hypothetical protein
MNPLTPVDSIYNNSLLLIDSISEIDITLKIEARNILGKALLLAAASSFEKLICNQVKEFVAEKTNSLSIISLIEIKAINRQYHTWFKWDGTNANNFFALFGPEFKNINIDKVKASPKLEESIKKFIELGSERNKLVHEDFATYQLDKTLDEIYQTYCVAKYFALNIKNMLNEVEF